MIDLNNSFDDRRSANGLNESPFKNSDLDNCSIESENVAYKVDLQPNLD